MRRSSPTRPPHPLETGRLMSIRAILIGATALIIAAVAMIQILAATMPSLFEPETGTTTGGAANVDISGASGGQALQFSTTSIDTRNLTAKGVGFAAPEYAYQSKATQDAWLADFQSMGITWIRFDIAWQAVQPTSGGAYQWASYDQAVNEAAAYGIKAVGIIDSVPTWARASACSSDWQCAPADNAAFGTFAAAVATHFGSRLGAIEIWNEPNIIQFWHPAPSGAGYTAMLKAAYSAIKAVDPNMLVISAGLSPADSDGTNIAPTEFVTAMYANGGKNSFDALGDHPYSYPAPPSSYQAWSGWSQLSSTSTSIRSVMTAAGDSTKHVWLTEIGAPTGGPGTVGTCQNYNLVNQTDHVDQCLQSQIITEAVAQAKVQSWAGVIFLYSYKDLGTCLCDKENFFGMLDSSGTRKSSYQALKQAITQYNQ